MLAKGTFDHAQIFCTQAFGIQLDSAANDACVGREGTISSANSAVKVLVIPTDEELSIAQQSLEAIKQERDLAH